MIAGRRALVAAMGVLVAMSAGAQVRLKAVSTKAQLVTGGDVLVEVSGLPVRESTPPRIRVNGRLAEGELHPGPRPGTMLALVRGLAVGRNVLQVAGARLEVTNWPMEGPVLSGPRQEPFLCQTQSFRLPDGSSLGKPIDAACSAPTMVQYMYLPQNSTVFKPMKDLTRLPDDVATTTTLRGDTVNFIVRVETGTMDRGIYQSAVLHDPVMEKEPTPWAPPKGWNRRLITLQGSGCTGGWYVQGSAMGVSPLDRTRLSEGYALIANTLNHSSNSCNAIVAGEATMMGKEHFIEEFGVPDWTVSVGGSGGAYTSLQIADAFPGLIDAVMIRATFPDALDIAMAGQDTHLLMHYFTKVAPGTFSEKQQVAVGGYLGLQAMIDAANQAQRTDPVPHRKDLEGYHSAVWKDVVPKELRYDPEKNPKGARPTIYDAARNVYGVNPATGFARRPFDNVGVQYGVSALNRGVITPTQFLDLNEGIGGVDEDSNYIAARTVGDPIAIRRAYQGGMMLSGGGGLRTIPILDDAKSDEKGGYHYGWYHFALRDRLREANGDSNNMVMWRRMPTGAPLEDLLDHWMAVRYERGQEGTRGDIGKPSAGVDGCFVGGHFVAEDLQLTSEPVTQCSELYPVYSNPRHEAGGPVAANVLKCRLRPVNVNDYKVAFSDEEKERLQRVFPEGVCDWTKPGVDQVPLVTWPSFGPSPWHRVE